MPIKSDFTSGVNPCQKVGMIIEFVNEVLHLERFSTTGGYPTPNTLTWNIPFLFVYEQK